MLIVMVLIVGAGFMIFKDGTLFNSNKVELAPVEFLEGTDNFGNNFTVEFYPEEKFCVLSIYMEESKTESWQWIDITNAITCNYINYQDDHYVVSYKADESQIGFCQSSVILQPLEETHDHTKDMITEYNSYIIEVTVEEDGNHKFNVYPATVTDEYTTELDDVVADESLEGDSVEDKTE